MDDSEQATPLPPGPRQLETEDVVNSDYDITIPATEAALPAAESPTLTAEPPVVPEATHIPDGAQGTSDSTDLATEVRSQTGHHYPLRDRARHKRTL